MSMPKIGDLFTTVLEHLDDGEVWSYREFRRRVIDDYDLTPEERSETIKGGTSRAISRCHWAVVWLIGIGAIIRPTKGHVQITDVGRDLLRAHPNGIRLEDVKATEGYKLWHQKVSKAKALKSSGAGVPEEPDDTGGNPEEQISQAISELHDSVGAELLDLLRKESPVFLEHVVLDVLHAMGYGEAFEDVSHLGGPGDEGVDGVINQDKLGLDQIYVQAKRYKEENPINGHTIQAFVGAVHSKGASRGVFITTSRFTTDAKKFAEKLAQPRIVLVDGNELAELMLQHEIGVTVDRTYKVYKIDQNFFET